MIKRTTQTGQVLTLVHSDSSIATTPKRGQLFLIKDGQNETKGYWDKLEAKYVELRKLYKLTK